MLAYEVLLDVVVVVLAVWFAVTQMVVPLIRGSALFPAFSKDIHSVENEIAAVEQQIEAERLRHELQHKRDELAHEQKGQD